MRYYCTKSNVTSFKLDKKGDILWAKNLDRQITYNRWNVYDVSVVKKDDSYYAVYGSAYQLNAKKKNMFNTKSGKQLTDRLEYAVFSNKTGDFKRAEYQINGFNTKKSNAKYVDESNITVFGSKMFTSCSRIKYKPSTFWGCLCPPVFYFLMFSGNSRKGKGYLGTITPIK